MDEFGVERMLDAHREAYERFAGMELFPALTFTEDLAAAGKMDLGAVLAQGGDESLQLDVTDLEPESGDLSGGEDDTPPADPTMPDVLTADVPPTADVSAGTTRRWAFDAEPALEHADERVVEAEESAGRQLEDTTWISRAEPLENKVPAAVKIETAAPETVATETVDADEGTPLTSGPGWPPNAAR